MFSSLPLSSEASRTSSFNIIDQSNNWYAYLFVCVLQTEALDSVQKRFKYTKKEFKHAKSKMRPATQSSRGGYTLPTKKQKDSETTLSESTCPICLKQASQIETICRHRFCREGFEQQRTRIKKIFLVSILSLQSFARS